MAQSTYSQDLKVKEWLLQDYCNKAFLSGEALFYHETFTDSAGYKSIAKLFLQQSSSNTLYGWDAATNKKKSVQFTFKTHERELIVNELINSANLKWGKEILAKASLLLDSEIPTNSIERVNFYDKLGNPKILSFSQPSFIRNGSVCVFFISTMQAKVGDIRIVIYEKTNGEWNFSFTSSLWFT